MEDNRKVKVKNRTNNNVGYSIPDMQNLKRQYSPREEKIITFEELRKLSYIPGGMQMLKEYLIVRDDEALRELNIQVEPEYYYTEKEVAKLMEQGSLNEFLDCLDFAPEGVLEVIKDVAVKLPLNDVAKRQAILDKMGFDVTKAIELKKVAEEDEKEVSSQGSGRRAAVPSVVEQSSSKESSNGRRVIISAEK